MFGAQTPLDQGCCRWFRSKAGNGLNEPQSKTHSMCMMYLRVKTSMVVHANDFPKVSCQFSVGGLAKDEIAA